MAVVLLWLQEVIVVGSVSWVSGRHRLWWCGSGIESTEDPTIKGLLDGERYFAREDGIDIRQL